MYDNREYKQIRLSKQEGTMVTPRIYNLLIGAVLLFGIGVNMAMALYLQNSISQMHPILMLVIYFGGSLVSLFVVYKSDNPAVSFVGFTGLSVSMGIAVTYIVAHYQWGDVTLAFLMTGLATALMLLLSTAFPRFFLELGRTLFMALLATVVIEIVFRIILHVEMAWMDYVVALLFAGYIGYDWSKAQQYPKTIDNAIDSAADIFVDIIGLFIRLLAIFGNRS